MNTPAAVFVVAAFLSAAAGAASDANPVDVIARGKFVRAIQTKKGEASATVCLPSTTPEERAKDLAGLPQLLVDLQAAGARAAVLDLPATDLPAPVFTASSLALIAPHSASTPAAASVRTGHREHAQAGPASVVTGIPAVQNHGGAPVLSIALEALAVHRGAPPPRHDGTQVYVGDQSWPNADGELRFMPYEIPFLHWSERATWSGVEGRTIFVGACRTDRDLTRFGRQPGTVAHAEQFETLRDGVVPRHGGAAASAMAGVLTTAAAFAARNLAPLLAPGLVGLVGLVVVAAAQLEGFWVGGTGVVVGAALAYFRR